MATSSSSPTASELLSISLTRSLLPLRARRLCTPPSSPLCTQRGHHPIMLPFFPLPSPRRMVATGNHQVTHPVVWQADPSSPRPSNLSSSWIICGCLCQCHHLNAPDYHARHVHCRMARTHDRAPVIPGFDMCWQIPVIDLSWTTSADLVHESWPPFLADREARLLTSGSPLLT